MSFLHGNFGRKRTEPPVFKYFKKSEENDGDFICQIKRDGDRDSDTSICGASIAVPVSGKTHSGTRTGNLLRHLKRYHPTEAEVITLQQPPEKKTKVEIFR